MPVQDLKILPSSDQILLQIQQELNQSSPNVERILNLINQPYQIDEEGFNNQCKTGLPGYNPKSGIMSGLQKEIITKIFHQSPEVFKALITQLQMTASFDYDDLNVIKIAVEEDLKGSINARSWLTNLISPPINHYKLSRLSKVFKQAFEVGNFEFLKIFLNANSKDSYLNDFFKSYLDLIIYTMIKNISAKASNEQVEEVFNLIIGDKDEKLSLKLAHIIGFTGCNHSHLAYLIFSKIDINKIPEYDKSFILTRLKHGDLKLPPEQINALNGKKDNQSIKLDYKNTFWQMLTAWFLSIFDSLKKTNQNNIFTVEENWSNTSLIPTSNTDFKAFNSNNSQFDENNISLQEKENSLASVISNSSQYKSIESDFLVEDKENDNNNNVM